MRPGARLISISTQEKCWAGDKMWVQLKNVAQSCLLGAILSLGSATAQSADLEKPETATAFDPNVIDRLVQGGFLQEAEDRCPESESVAALDPYFQLTPYEVSNLQQQIGRCWTVPSLSRIPAVELSLSLCPDGSLKRPPEIVDKQAYAADVRFRVVAESAVRAVRSCAPYSLLQTTYSSWRRIDIKFDPAEMLVD